MNRKKQIIEIKECIDSVYGADCAYFDVDGFAIANKIYDAGYRKQSEGEWVQSKDWQYDYICSVCGNTAHKGDYGNYDSLSKFCPNCGAKMKGGAE